MVEGTLLTPNSTPLYKTEQYYITRDSVVQGHFVAQAVSATKIISNYNSQVYQTLPAQIFFKFGLNGHDNEMAYGQNHVVCLNACDRTFITPIIKFGEQFILEQPAIENAYLAPNTNFTIRLDLREILSSFTQNGFYETSTGQVIKAADFSGVYVAGSVSPLMWNFSELPHHPELKLEDKQGNGIYEISLILNPQPAETTKATAQWSLTKNTNSLPQYKSDYVILNALYNLALEEMIQAVEPDNTFRTGKEWAGVWTRDVSYSIILALAAVHPEVSQHSLEQKIKDGHIVQDTGTGGAYPVSTDRQIWAVAAWEIYLVTGSLDWLKQAFQVIQASLADDYQNIYDSQTGLVRGESSFLDWREQTYPVWMQPADIYESECLGTNAVHYQANVVLAKMALELNNAGAHTKYSQIAASIKAGINKYLWRSEFGYYGQYLYGRTFKILSPRAEALGEALCVLFDIAEPAQKQEIVAKTPIGNYGISCIYPQIPEIKPYHNKAVWPFVQGYWSLAAAKVGNQAALTESISAMYRPNALFLTHKENFVSATGDYGGTQINSDNMLWSLAGSLSITYRIFFGLHFTPDGLIFKPFVPQGFAGKHHLSNFKYRQAVLDIYLEGFGNIIKDITLNGKILPKAKLSANLVGKQEIRIRLKDSPLPPGEIHKVGENNSPAMPMVTFAEDKLTWAQVNQAVAYNIIKNGKLLHTTSNTNLILEDQNYAEYQVIAVGADGSESFASEPLVAAAKTAFMYKLGLGNANGYVEITKDKNTLLQVRVAIPETGTYAIDVRYANGNGPIGTDNKCALRTLSKEGAIIGTLVLPQRGLQAWSDWGYSNAIVTKLEKEITIFTLAFLPANENMNGEINQALVDYIRFIKID